jgi:hypothetical protein
VRGQQAQGTQVERAFAQQAQDRRESSADVRGHDPVQCGVFGQPEYLRAVPEQRTATLGEVKLPPVQLRKVGDQCDGLVALLRGKGCHAAQ